MKEKVTGRGGKREGAGRPKGTGKFGCETTSVRVPKKNREIILEFAEEINRAEKSDGFVVVPLFLKEQAEKWVQKKKKGLEK